MQDLFNKIFHSCKKSKLLVILILAIVAINLAGLSDLSLLHAVIQKSAFTTVQAAWALLLVHLIDKFYFGDYDTGQEIRRGNIAVAIVTVGLFVCFMAASVFGF